MFMSARNAPRYAKGRFEDAKRFYHVFVRIKKITFITSRLTSIYCISFQSN